MDMMSVLNRGFIFISRVRIYPTAVNNSMLNRKRICARTILTTYEVMPEVLAPQYYRHIWLFE